MDEYIRQLQAYVREYKIIFEEDCPQPCLDALWWHYGEYNNMDSSQAKKGFKNLRACLDSLPIKTAMWWLERLGACAPSMSGSPLPLD